MDKTRRTLVQRVRTFEDVRDDGSIPREKVGAAGWDVSELGFRPTNWHSSDLHVKSSNRPVALHVFSCLFRREDDLCFDKAVNWLRI